MYALTAQPCTPTPALCAKLYLSPFPLACGGRIIVAEFRYNAISSSPFTRTSLVRSSPKCCKPIFGLTTHSVSSPTISFCVLYCRFVGEPPCVYLVVPDTSWLIASNFRSVRQVRSCFLRPNVATLCSIRQPLPCFPSFERWLILVARYSLVSVDLPPKLAPNPSSFSSSSPPTDHGRCSSCQTYS